MKVTPERKSIAPGYPTRDVLLTHPDLLRVTPQNWQRNALITGIITAMAGLSGNTQLVAAGKGRVAPLFKHGPGTIRAVYGTTFSNEPVLIPEDEARQIINEELRKSAITITHTGLPSYRASLTLTGKGNKPPKRETVTVELDGMDGKRHIAYEYISVEDVKAFGLNTNEESIIPAAEELCASLDKVYPRETIGTFYDPGISLSWVMGGPRENDPTPNMTAATGDAETALMPFGIFRGKDHGMGMTAEVKGVSVTLTNDTNVVILTVGSKTATINGKAATLPTPPIRRGGVVYAPVRAVVEGLGYTVKQDGAKKTITIEGDEFICFEKVPEGQPPQKRFIKQAHTSPIFRLADDAKSPAFAFIRYTTTSNDGMRFSHSSWDAESRTALAKEQACQDLRLQVRDFIAWLKAEKML